MTGIAAGVLAFSVVVSVALDSGRAAAQPRDARVSAEHGANGAELSAQRRYRRPPLRIEVRPRQRLLYRDCRAWLEREWRPSGEVVVPRRRCWWVRG